MSRLSLTMKSLLAMGAATALTITASADEPKTKPEIAEDAKAMVAGSGAGKATFKDLSVTAKGGGDDDEFEWQQGAVESEGDIALNVPVAAPNDKLGDIEGESKAMRDDGGLNTAEDTPPLAEGGDIESEGDIELNVPMAAPNDKLGPIKGESQVRAAAIKFDGIDGETVDKATVKDGEDRLTENLELNYSTVKGEVSEDIEDAAEKTDPPKNLGSEIPRPMQRR